MPIQWIDRIERGSNMPSDIKGLPPGGGASHSRPTVQANQNHTASSNVAGNAAATNNGVQQQAAARPDTVQLSDQAKAMMKMEQRAAQAPSTNSQKIAQIRAALADGSYTIDAESVAKKMLDIDALF